MLKLNSNLTATPPVLTRTETSAPTLTSATFQTPTFSIPDMVANTSGFGFLPQFNQNSFLAQQTFHTNIGPIFNFNSPQTIWPLANPVVGQPQLTIDELMKAVMPTTVVPPIAPTLRPVDMPVLSPLLPGISSTMPSFATLPLVSSNDVYKNIDSSVFSVNQSTTFDQNLSPPILEQQIPQDPATSTSAISFEMPSLTTSNSFGIPMFHNMLAINEHEKNLDISSAPSSPPILTRIDDPIQNDDPNSLALNPEVFEMVQEKHAQSNNDGKTDSNLLPNEPPKLEQEGIYSSISSAQENCTLLPDSSSSSQEESFLNNTETSITDSSALEVVKSKLNLEEEPILDSLEAIKKFSEELNLSEADWLEIMTESRRRKLRPSTQANTVATLTKITNSSHNKNGKIGKKHRSSGSSEREATSAKVAKMDLQYNENESENQAPSSSTDLYSSPISIDVDFCKESFKNSTPSSSGVSSSSNLSEQSPKHQSKWKVLRRAKNGNTIWLASQNYSEEQKENVFLDRIPEETSSPSKGNRRRHTICSKRTPKKPKRIKSNWQPIGKPVDKMVRLCNDASPSIQQCYTAIKHRHETDEIIRVRDCIKVRSAEGLENIGKVMNFYVDENTGYLMANVLWYYTREQIDSIKNPLLIPLHEKELLASRHIDSVACDAIESVAFVLTFSEYCRYITEGQIDSLPVCLRPLESQEIWPRGEEDYPRRSRLPHEDSPFEVVYFSRRVYDVKMKRVYVPKLTSSLILRPTRSTLNRPIRASSH
uniref:BAH domain-containing protein n=2 Tax=Acrobeloides nanus TaxID=290746 RepID=A0A914C6L0_9BILA